ncbi:hypothetical protein ACFPM4_11085 [Lederbergia graminis]|uniref:ABC transporter permease n=2 Tax=Lederbergia graminis TaxID=735518 RepID=A0ABW0LL41_9BACI
MMSLAEVNITNLVKKQFSFKTRAFLGVFSSLAMTQILGIILSLTGVASSGFFSDELEINLYYYSANMVIMLSMIWALISGILITARATRYDDFSFVTNRLSSNIANILFLITASVVAGILAMASSYFLRIITYFDSDVQLHIAGGVYAKPNELLIGIIATVLLLLLFSSIGYFVGMLIQINKVFSILLPVLLFGLMVVDGVSGGDNVKKVYEFIFKEASLGLFTVKIIVISALLFVTSIIMTNRLEVRK